MSTAIISKKQITSRVVYNQFRESLETSFVDVVTFSNGLVERFDSFLNEVSNEKWCSIYEQMEMRKTSSKVKKEIFANKYAEKFLSVGGRNN